MQTHTAQNNNLQYTNSNSVNHHSTQLQGNHSNGASTKNDLQFFNPQEPSSTTHDQRLSPFNPTHITQQLAMPMEPYPFATTVPFQTIPSSQEENTKKRLPLSLIPQHDTIPIPGIVPSSELAGYQGTRSG